MDKRIAEKRKLRQKRNLQNLIKALKKLSIILLIALFIMFLVDSFLISVITIEGKSMENTLTEEQKVLVKKIGIKVDNIKRDDLIYFDLGDDRQYIKRVIALPGDIVEIKNGKVIINGKEKKEDYIVGGETLVYDTDKWFLSEDEFFVLGDNRLKDFSKDSRIFGAVKFKNIKGVVIHKFK